MALITTFIFWDMHRKTIIYNKDKNIDNVIHIIIIQ